VSVPKHQLLLTHFHISKHQFRIPVCILTAHFVALKYAIRNLTVKLYGGIQPWVFSEALVHLKIFIDVKSGVTFSESGSVESEHKGRLVFEH